MAIGEAWRGAKYKYLNDYIIYIYNLNFSFESCQQLKGLAN